MSAREIHDLLIRSLVSEGKIIESGFVAFKIMAIPPSASKTQIDQMRLAFISGAQHLFASVMNVLDEDREPTDNDMRNMAFISNEIDAIQKELELRFSETSTPQ